MNAVELVQEAMQRAEEIRPRVGGYPYLAECLRQAGVLKNVWTLPSAQSSFWTVKGAVAVTDIPLVTGAYEVPTFDEVALRTAIKIDQAGETTLGGFLSAAWQAGVTYYVVDFVARTISYHGALGEVYVESYPAVEID